jgi:hypothetical protein
VLEVHGYKQWPPSSRRLFMVLRQCRFGCRSSLADCLGVYPKRVNKCTYWKQLDSRAEKVSMVLEQWLRPLTKIRKQIRNTVPSDARTLLHAKPRVKLGITSERWGGDKIERQPCLSVMINQRAERLSRGRMGCAHRWRHAGYIRRSGNAFA